MTDSDLSNSANFPGDANIEKTLRQVVRDALGRDETITVNLARSRAEVDLGLDAGFLKDDATWKRRSKQIISAAVEDPPSPEKRKKSAPEPKSKIVAKVGIKRKFDEPLPKQKRRKNSIILASDEVDEDEQVEEDEASELTQTMVVPPKSSRAPETDDEDDEDDEAHENGNAEPRKKLSESRGTFHLPREEDRAGAPKIQGKPIEDDESDLSSVIDDEPAPKKKKRQKKASTSTDSTSKTKTPRKPTGVGKDLSPDEEEIKRLQSWLLKCGVRKVWSKELARYPASKEKIKHLKKMLEDMGMIGRYSVEKAKQIKDARELAAEIEAAKEFNKTWGQKKDGHENDDEDDEAEGDTKPERLRPKGLIDFGDSGDEGSD